MKILLLKKLKFVLYIFLSLFYLNKNFQESRETLIIIIIWPDFHFSELLFDTLLIL